ncbi:hypothetical protein SLS62_003461 [Diatrype stigma]|uniref:F-box domain-containing protein n=1 Tax=Diatrype stigma TaxID=117547 RepID=A0AAN9UVV6_9PEZI
MAPSPPPQQHQQQQPSALGMDLQPQEQQPLVIQTRYLTLPIPSSSSDSHAGTPLGYSPRLAPFADRGIGDAPHHFLEQGESASMVADVPAVLDAQPTPSRAMGNQGSVAAGEEGTEIFHELPGAADQISAIGLRRSSASRSMTEAPENLWPSGDEQVSPDCRAAKSVLFSTTPRNSPPLSLWSRGSSSLDGMPNEILTHILSFLDVCDLLATSRTNHHFRALSVHPLLHVYRLRRARAVLPPLLTSPSRPTLSELIARHIFQTHTTQVSRRLAHNLAAIRLSRRLPQRPSAESLAQRGVLPPECVVGISSSSSSSSSSGGSLVGARGGWEGANGTGRGTELGRRGGMGTNTRGGLGGGTVGGLVKKGRGTGAGIVPLSPALVARKRAVERERLKDGLRRWVGAVWRGEVRERSEGIRRREESAGVGRVWRLRRFWESVGREDAA